MLSNCPSMGNDEQNAFYCNLTTFIWNIIKICVLVAIMDAILDFSMKNPHPDLAPGPESLPIVSSST